MSVEEDLVSFPGTESQPEVCECVLVCGLSALLVVELGFVGIDMTDKNQGGG